MKKDYYAILGVNKNASEDEIKKAFRKLAHQHHPDKQGGDEKKFKEANEAYQVLSDQEKRKKYDQFGDSFDQHGAGGQGFSWEDYAQQSGFGANGNFDMGDLGEMFGDLFGFGGRGGGQQRQARGSNLQLEMTIDFREAVFGEKKDIRFARLHACSHCNGNGAEPGSNRHTCDTCKGSGQVMKVQRSIFGAMQTAAVCTTCHGTGSIIEKPCKECKGAGTTRKETTLSVSIPAGIDNGETIRLKGEGDAGPHGAPAGDLYLVMRVRPDKRFTRQGSELFLTIPIRVSDSVLGTTMSIETMDGKVDMKIPPGTQSGTNFRLANMGVHHLNRNGRGNLIVTVEVTPPKTLSKKQRELLEKLKEEGL